MERKWEGEKGRGRGRGGERGKGEEGEGGREEGGGRRARRGKVGGEGGDSALAGGLAAEGLAGLLGRDGQAWLWGRCGPTCRARVHVQTRPPSPGEAHHRSGSLGKQRGGPGGSREQPPHAHACCRVTAAPPPRGSGGYSHSPRAGPGGLFSQGAQRRRLRAALSRRTPAAPALPSPLTLPWEQAGCPLGVTDMSPAPQCPVDSQPPSRCVGEPVPRDLMSDWRGQGCPGDPETWSRHGALPEPSVLWGCLFGSTDSLTQHSQPNLVSWRSP